ncbi:hypothetical protein BDV25DRAFT_150787 [Aspergillus avenaceus]|uniref:PBP domain-containing protein n=1 Tax=Aspergillus avenaceus TaxID=36643 RepID=A0A5N6U241_ASPAV|nr:hypothetical protein BDV25DRAFT_150787 [Aspergillus avenaceus]
MRFIATSLALWATLTAAAPSSEITEKAKKYEAEYTGKCGDKNHGKIALRIGNGGAGQSGLVGALADAFIDHKVPDCHDTGNLFKVAWVKGDTTETINNLKNKDIDIGITYHEVAEQNAITGGIAKGCQYKNDSLAPCFNDCDGAVEKPCRTFRDHFYLVGPKSNPAEIDSEEDDIVNTFRKIYETGERGETKFLSRFDKSATNIIDSKMWIDIGQVPWAKSPAKWYYKFSKYPLEALTKAIKKKYYTITDRGTYLTLKSQNEKLTNRTVIYQTGEKHEKLLNPADIITLNDDAESAKMIKEFVEWVHSPEGQNVIWNYTAKDSKPKYCLYKGFDDNSVPPNRDCEWELNGSVPGSLPGDEREREDL